MCRFLFPGSTGSTFSLDILSSIFLKLFAFSWLVLAFCSFFLTELKILFHILFQCLKLPCRNFSSICLTCSLCSSFLSFCHIERIITCSLLIVLSSSSVLFCKYITALFLHLYTHILLLLISPFQPGLSICIAR